LEQIEKGKVENDCFRVLKEKFAKYSKYILHVDEIQDGPVIKPGLFLDRDSSDVSMENVFMVILSDWLYELSRSNSFSFLTGTNFFFSKEVRFSSRIKPVVLILPQSSTQDVANILHFFFDFSFLKDDSLLSKVCGKLAGCFRGLTYFIYELYSSSISTDLKKTIFDCVENAYNLWKGDVMSIVSKMNNANFIFDLQLILFQLSKKLNCFPLNKLSVDENLMYHLGNSGSLLFSLKNDNYELIKPYPFLQRLMMEKSNLGFDERVMDSLFSAQYLDHGKNKGKSFQHLVALELVNESSKLKQFLFKLIGEKFDCQVFCFGNDTRLKNFCDDRFSCDILDNDPQDSAVHEVIESRNKKPGDIALTNIVVGKREVNIFLEVKYSRTKKYIKDGMKAFFDACQKRNATLNTDDIYIFLSGELELEKDEVGWRNSKFPFISLGKNEIKENFLFKFEDLISHFEENSGALATREMISFFTKREREEESNEKKDSVEKRRKEEHLIENNLLEIRKQISENQKQLGAARNQKDVGLIASLEIEKKTLEIKEKTLEIKEAETVKNEKNVGLIASLEIEKKTLEIKKKTLEIKEKTLEIEEKIKKIECLLLNPACTVDKENLKNRKKELEIEVTCLKMKDLGL